MKARKGVSNRGLFLSENDTPVIEKMEDNKLNVPDDSVYQKLKKFQVFFESYTLM